MQPRWLTLARGVLLAAAFALLLAVVVALGGTVWAGHDNVWLPLGALLWVTAQLVA